MARGLKSRGIIELRQLRDRARRQLALGRIYPEDCEFIVTRLDDIEARIIGMMEMGEHYDG